MVTTPFHTCSLTEWNCVSICFALLWNCGFFDIAIDPSLSPKIIVGNVCANPSSSNKFLNQCASHIASDKAIYSASMVDNAVTDCFLEYQVIAPLDILKMYPVVDFRSLASANEALA